MKTVTSGSSIVEIEEVSGVSKKKIESELGFSSVIQCGSVIIATSNERLFFYDSKTYENILTENLEIFDIKTKVIMETSRQIETHPFRLLKINEEVFVLYGIAKAILYSSTTKSVIDGNFFTLPPVRVTSSHDRNLTSRISCMKKISNEKILCFGIRSVYPRCCDAYVLSLKSRPPKKISVVSNGPISQRCVCFSKKFLDVFFIIFVSSGYSYISMVDYDRDVELRSISSQKMYFSGFCINSFLAQQNDGDEESEIVVVSDRRSFSFFRIVDSLDEECHLVGKLDINSGRELISDRTLNYFTDQLIFCIRLSERTEDISKETVQGGTILKRMIYKKSVVSILDITSHFNEIGTFTLKADCKEQKEIETKKNEYYSKKSDVKRRFKIPIFKPRKMKKKRGGCKIGIHFLRQDRKVVDFIVYGEEFSQIFVLSSSNLPLSNIDMIDAVVDFRDRIHFILEDCDMAKICDADEETYCDNQRTKPWIVFKICTSIGSQKEFGIFRSFLIA